MKLQSVSHYNAYLVASVQTADNDVVIRTNHMNGISSVNITIIVYSVPLVPRCYEAR
jgi:hypothetical protein